eukprot:TRINITY_DN6174_c0_g1_i1.p1 TRINITY_DN6174_c0_g1~~TRINITY_DN6174_c0_g1_i1.p1  ORF type:complete len:1151 (+),score=506.15 TRINITY_DN6174_c0_g1_i1:78-3455(+)
MGQLDQNPSVEEDVEHGLQKPVPEDDVAEAPSPIPESERSTYRGTEGSPTAMRSTRRSRPLIDDDDEEEALNGPWKQNYDPSGPVTLILMGIFGFMALACFSLTIVAATTEDFRRVDEYNPGYLAVRDRFFTRIRPFIMRDPNEYTLGNDCVSLTISEYETGLLQPPYWRCRFRVPYEALWAGMTISFLGFTTVCFFARDVMSNPRGTDTMSNTSHVIHKAAMKFLHLEYAYLTPFVFVLWVFLFVAIDGQENDWVPAASVSFLFGAFLSATCGYMGMHIATQGNCRTAAVCFSSKRKGLSRGLQVAFRTGSCMGLGVVSCGLFGLTLSYAIFGNVEALAGFGFGSSAVALFARVGGGIYTKAADVGADLCGKVDKGLAEDSPKNPATIADCVGDNVGDVAGMGADLFESFVGAIVAASVLGASEFGETGAALPFWIAGLGLFISIVVTAMFRVIYALVVRKSMPGLMDLLWALRVTIIISAILFAIGATLISIASLQDENEKIRDADMPYITDGVRDMGQVNPHARIIGSMMLGLLAGILIGFVTEHFTSHVEEPTQSIGRATEYGPGPVVIQGLGMGMYSTVLPVLFIMGAILGSYYLCGFYGTAMACVGMLSTLGVTMSADAFGPVADNAGGIAEMSELPEWVRDTTDSLDALGNTTAATGKGFANASAVLSAVSTLIAFSRVANIEAVNILQPVVVVGVLVGSMLPFLFSAMTMLSVNRTAQEMMVEVRRQFEENPAILSEDPEQRPDYDRCIEISCKSSLFEMVPPALLAIFSPLVFGFIFGSHALLGMLIGALASGYLLGVAMSNSGGAWDNAKKWIEAGHLVIDGQQRGKHSDCHKAAVCGDTVGDPFKDTSGPALNILIKLMTRFAFVLAPLFEAGWDKWWVGMYILFGMVLVAAIGGGVIAVLIMNRKPKDDVLEIDAEHRPEQAPQSPFEEADRLTVEDKDVRDDDLGDMMLDTQGKEAERLTDADHGEMEVGGALGTAGISELDVTAKPTADDDDLAATKPDPLADFDDVVKPEASLGEEDREVEETPEESEQPDPMVPLCVNGVLGLVPPRDEEHGDMNNDIRMPRVVGNVVHDHAEEEHDDAQQKRADGALPDGYRKPNEDGEMFLYLDQKQ